MQLNVQTPRKFLNPLLSQKSVVSTDVEAFKAALGIYVENVQQLTASKQSELNIVAGALMPFLQALPLGYNCRPHSQKGQSGIDLAILSGKDVTVIIEAKAVGSNDMITAHDLNRKAFHEAIFYFMQEREKGNDKLTHIVITDFYQWFVFDAKDFDNLFWRNTQLQKKLKNFHDPSSLFRNTNEVYEAIATELPKLREEIIDCAYFNLSAPVTIKDKELTAIYKLLSPDSLLKGFNPNDANSLNREFYNELLYILGLNEVKDGGKRLIQASGIAGSLYDGIADKLDQKGAPHAFEDVIKLIIIWINRVLFLKLLESQIVTWTGEKTSRFLSADKINGYDALENLFFDTLARRIPDRKNKGFDYIPYLNSSLFEMQEEEKTGISISALPDGAQIAYYGKTVVKDATTKRKSGQTSTLAYLFEFLDSYDFANDNDDEVREETKSLISASVLGLIFEKINGYKDGSFYTPSFVTMYMARQTIEKAVLQKFNEAYGWTCAALTGEGGLKNELKDHKVKKTDSNALIDSLKICDPAVGSGHFLVSALNEILYIKSLLALLVDEAGDVLDYDIVIENDELIVTSDKGELFEYKKGSKEKTLVQKTLFQEKQKIIENCLFGVDINPNSVNICRLRLWIELLKNAYYQPNGELETLPNIDINIKCGNSLISRFALDTDLKGALKKSKITVDEYRIAVSNYRNTSDKAEKRQIEALIERIKSNFRTEIQYYDPKQKRIEDLPKLIKALEASQSLLSETEKEEKERKQKQTKLQTEFTKLSIEIDEIKTNVIYKNAFEWRFEFPEVMDAEGKFVGFDVVIGNPPYGSLFSETEKSYIQTTYKYSDYQFDIYMSFFEIAHRLLKQSGQLCNIVPNTWLLNLKTPNIRYLLFNYFNTYQLRAYSFPVFDEAVVDTVIVFSIKDTTKDGYLCAEVIAKNGNSIENLFEKKYLSENYRKHVNIYLNNFASKIESKFSPLIKLTSVAKITQGTKPFQIGKGKPKQDETILKEKPYVQAFKKDSTFRPLLRGSLMNRYVISWDNNYYISLGDWLAEPRYSAGYDTPCKIVIRQTGSSLISAIDTDQFVVRDNLYSIISTNDKYSEYVLLAFLNSKLLNWYYQNIVNNEVGEALAQVKRGHLELLPVPIFNKATFSAIEQHTKQITEE
jgi:adenine-specific DNA-methyltransferase